MLRSAATVAIVRMIAAPVAALAILAAADAAAENRATHEESGTAKIKTATKIAEGSRKEKERPFRGFARYRPKLQLMCDGLREDGHRLTFATLIRDNYESLKPCPPCRSFFLILSQCCRDSGMLSLEEAEALKKREKYIAAYKAEQDEIAAKAAAAATTIAVATAAVAPSASPEILEIPPAAARTAASGTESEVEATSTAEPKAGPEDEPDAEPTPLPSPTTGNAADDDGELGESAPNQPRKAREPNLVVIDAVSTAFRGMAEDPLMAERNLVAVQKLREILNSHTGFSELERDYFEILSEYMIVAFVSNKIGVPPDSEEQVRQAESTADPEQAFDF